MGQHPQLNLAVVGVHQKAARLGGEEPAHPAPRLGADGDILHIGLQRGDAAGAGFSLVEGGVDAPVRPHRVL